jgi:hypothetical protein
MALYNEMSMDDYNKLVARNQQRQSQAAAQNLANRQAALQAAQGKKQGSLVDTLVGLATGLKDKAVDAYDTAKNIGKTVVGGINQLTGNYDVAKAQKDDSTRRNEIAKQFGYNSYSDAINSGTAGDDFWNAIKENNKTTQKQLKDDAKIYRNNVGNVTNIDLNKAKGQALNTIDTVGMALSGPSGVAANIIGGGLTGIGDEYKAAAAEGRDFNANNAKVNAIAGMAGGAAGSGAGGMLGKAANKAGGNALGKILGSQLGQGIGSGAAAGAAGAAAGTLAQGGTLQDALTNAWEGAKGGAVAGGAMAGTMGLAGNALNRIRGGRATNIADNAPIRNSEPAEAQIVQKNRVEAPTAQRIAETVETPSNRRGIAIKDLNAGIEEIPVRVVQGVEPAQSQGRYIDSVVRRADANLPEAKVPTVQERFARNLGNGDTLENIVARGEMGAGNDFLTQMRAAGVTPDDIQNLKTGAQAAAADNSPFSAYGMNNRQDLPMLDRQEYYNDTIGKIGRDSNANLRAEDIPSYMQDKLRNDAGKDFASNRDNESIMREVFGNNLSKEDMYKLYEELAQTAQQPTYTADNFGYALALDPELSQRVQQSFLDTYNPAQKIDVLGGPAIADNIPVTDRTTRYAENTLPAKQYKQAVAKMPEAETTTPKPVVENATVQTEPEIDYNTQIQRQKAQIQADKLKRQAIGGVMEQYGTTRLSDRIEGLPNAIEDMLKLGFTERAEIDNYAKQMTGKDSEIAKAIRKSLNDAGTTDTNLGITMEDVFASSGAEEAAQKKIKSFFDARQKKYTTDNGTIKRADLYDLGKELEKEGYKKYDRGVRNQNTTDQAYGEALITLSEAAIGKATDGVDVSKNIDLNKLIAIAPDNAEHIARMENLAQNAKTVQDLRSAMANATKLNLLKQAEEYNRNTYGQNQGDFGKNANNAIKGIKAANSRNPVIALTQAGVEMATESPKMKQKAIKKAYEKAQKYQSQANGETPIQTGKLAGIKEKVANIKDAGIVQGAKNIAGKAGEKLGNATSKLNDTTAANIAIGGNTIGNIAQNMANRTIAKDQAEFANNRANAAQAQAAYDQAATDYTTALANQQAAEQNVLQGQTGNTTTLNRIAQAMDLAMAAGDINAYSQLADLYKQAYNIYEMQNPQAKNEGKALSANQSKALAAQQQLEQLAQMTPNAGTVASNIPLLGNLVDLTGGNEYANQAEALATTLGYLLSGANIKESEAKRIGQSYVPTAFDSENVRQQKLDRARQLIQSYMSDTGALAA